MRGSEHVLLISFKTQRYLLNCVHQWWQSWIYIGCEKHIYSNHNKFNIHDLNSLMVSVSVMKLFQFYPEQRHLSPDILNVQFQFACACSRSQLNQILLFPKSLVNYPTLTRDASQKSITGDACCFLTIRQSSI